MTKQDGTSRNLIKRVLMRAGIIDRPRGTIDAYRMTPAERDDYFTPPLTAVEEAFLGHQGRTIHKWAHYLPIYEKLFGGLRGRALTFLEIGVSLGGSLELWHGYFGPEATIVGLDIDPECATRFDPPNQVFIGSQADPDFLRDVVARIGTPDIVLDDGSHIAAHQKATFDTLFPLLGEGGLYVIEDTHTAYWPEGYDGGYRRTGTAIEVAKSFVDDMHAWYHQEHFDPLIRDHVHSIAFYDSIIAIEKRAKLPPRHLASPPVKR
jgi:cephalosporin hydroxylase